MAGYGTTCKFASMLGHKEVHNLLNETLQEKKSADQELNQIAEKKVNERAMS